MVKVLSLRKQASANQDEDTQDSAVILEASAAAIWIESMLGM